MVARTARDSRSCVPVGQEAGAGVRPGGSLGVQGAPGCEKQAGSLRGALPAGGACEAPQPVDLGVWALAAKCICDPRKARGTSGSKKLTQARDD